MSLDVRKAISAITLSLVLAALLAGCALAQRLALGDSAPTSATSATAAGAPSGAPKSTADSAASGGTPTSAYPSASVPVAIPDPLHPLEHRAGESVDIGQATIVFMGMAEVGGDSVARFRVSEGAWPDGAHLMSDTGGMVDLTPSGSMVQSGKFAEPPGQLTLLVGERLFVFAV